MKLPAIQFYPGDWWKDPGVKMLTLEERGFWFQCLLLMHESDRRGFLAVNGKPMPESGIAMVMGLDNHKVNQILTKLVEFGVASLEEGSGILFSRRMVRDEEIRKTRKEAGKLGGNPLLLNHEVNQNSTTKVNHFPTPSSSSSSSISSSDVNKRFSPPSKEEVELYASKIGLPAIEAEKFVNHFTANGWKVGGKTTMKCWQSAMRNWKINFQSRVFQNNQHKPSKKIAI